MKRKELIPLRKQNLTYTMSGLKTALMKLNKNVKNKIIMVLGFKTKIDGKLTYFVQKILACVMPEYKKEFIPKIHSIRNGNRWKAGMLIHMATGVRTKNYFQFNQNIRGLEQCKSVQSIDIQYSLDYIYVIIDGKTEAIWRNHKSLDNDFYSNEIDCPMIFQLAKNDGFNSVTDFFRWFNSNFKGQIIHWTDFRY